MNVPKEVASAVGGENDATNGVQHAKVVAGEDHAGTLGQGNLAFNHNGQSTAVVVNPGALTPPENSDEEKFPGNDAIEADEDLLDGEPLTTDEILCTHSRVSSIKDLRLERFRHVIRVCLRQNRIPTIDGLDGLSATLKDLDLYDNVITDISGLDPVKLLTSLDLSFNKIRDINHIDHLTELEELYLVANKISMIEGLDHLTKLRSLELGSNRIRELRGLDMLSSLEKLWVAKNKITQISGLGGLRCLRLLSIQANRIDDLSPLAEIPWLEELYVSQNALTSVAGLSANVHLRIVDIGYNAITSLAGLGPLVKLEELWASYNQLADFSELDRYLADKPLLSTVYFEHCPLQLRAPTLYRNKVRLALPQIKQIDATFVAT